jgi:hypothetical protein
MTSCQDVSEFLDILGLVKSYFSNFFEKKNKKNREFFFCGAPDAPEDEAICLFAGLLANPDMALSPSPRWGSYRI